MRKISLPKIGVYPVIGSRRMGVRGSPEEQTMNMVKATATLLTERLRHACGATVKCVISDTCIAGVVEAAACEEKLDSQNVGLTITMTPCWCYSSETIDMDPTHPRAVQDFNDTKRPGAVYLTTAPAAHSQKGIPTFSIYGHNVQDADDTSIPADVGEKLLHFTCAGLAVASTKGKSYLSLNDILMGIAGSVVNYNFFESWLEMKVQAVGITELRRRIDQKICDEAELEMALAWTDKDFRYGGDENNKQYQRNVEQSRAVLRKSLLIAMCIHDAMQGSSKLADTGRVEESLNYNIIAAGFQGQRHWADQYPNSDTAEAVLNSSFNWNGVHKLFVVATENDSLNGVTMLMSHQLTGTAQVFTDARAYWSPEAIERVMGHKLDGLTGHGVIHLINSGSATLDGSCRQRDSEGNPTVKPHWEISQQETDACSATTEWRPAIHEYFRSGGYFSRFLAEGSVSFTMIRVSIIKGLGPVLQIAEGWSIGLPENMHDILNRRTSSTWPTTWFAPRLIGKGLFIDVYSIMVNWGANHGVLTIGHVDTDLIILASMLRIPICIHNVEETKVYHPSAWVTHGMDIESQDYHACRNYGPLYKCQYMAP